MAKMLAAMLMLTLLGASLAFAADGGDDAQSGDSGQIEQLNASPIPASAEEIPAERTATSATYELPSGERLVEIFQAPINFKEDGEWRRIDTGLDDAPGVGLTNGQNSFDLQIPETMGEGSVRVREDDQWVSYRLLGSGADLIDQEQRAVTYETASGAVAFELTSLPTGVKEEIQLAGPSAPSSYAFELKASAGITPEIAEDGSLRFEGDDGNIFAVLPAPTIADADDPAPALDAVSYELSEGSAGTWRLKVVADENWLNEPDRAWPATIDPTLIIPSPSLDCNIFNGPFAEFSLCGSSGWKAIGGRAIYKATSTEYARSLLRFDTTTIPAKASISSATLGLYSPMTAKNTSGVSLRRALKTWTANANWKRYATGLNWTNEGGDYGSLAASISTATRGTAPGWWEFSSSQLAALVDGWAEGSIANQGVLLRLSDEESYSCCIERLVEFSSSAAEASKRPYLSVTYFPPAPSGEVSSPGDGTRSAKRFTLAAKWTHAGVTGVTFQYRDPEKGWLTVPEAKVRTKGNQSVKWPFATEGKESEPIYWEAPEAGFPVSKLKFQIRAVFAGTEGADGYTKPVEVELNRETGGPKDATASVGPGTLDLLTGNFTVSRTDVAISAFLGALEFSRSHNSRDANAEPKGVLGPGWRPGAPLEEAGESAWASVREVTEKENYEGEEFEYTYAILTDTEGVEIAFEKEGGNYIAPPELSGFQLAPVSGSTTQVAFTDPGGNRTVFDNGGSGTEYLPASISMPGGAGNKSRMTYGLAGGKRRLTKVIAPTPAGVSCPDETAQATVGCRVLIFSYKSPAELGTPTGSGDRLVAITYHAANSSTTMGSWQVANYSYDAQGRLSAAWDPRVSPALKETYAYEANGKLRTITPPGLEPWTLEYGTVPGDAANGRLLRVKRPSLVASPAVAQTTIAYDVPISGESAPNDLSPAAAAQWGQQAPPVDATAIFPPDQIPSSPPSSYSRATVYYMDVEGQLSNTATPSGAGTSAPSISTQEYDRFGNVVRELAPQNRLRALAKSSEAEKIARSKELDTKRVFADEGTELIEEWGPMHQVRLGNGSSSQARLYSVTNYDAGYESVAGVPDPHLPTKVVTGALVGGEVLDQRISETKYDWTLRAPNESIIDPSGLNIRTVTNYDSISGLPTEQRQPSNPGGGGAGTTKTTYWSSGGSGICSGSARYAGLPCLVEPAAQPGTSGQPQIKVTKVAAYNQLSQPTEAWEAPGLSALESGSPRRTTTTTYDSAGRALTAHLTGGGAIVPKVITEYSSTTGLPTTQRFDCTTEGCEGSDDEAITTEYDALGRATDYTDADGNTSTVTYDLLGRPVSTDDGKGTQTRTYDPTSGLLVELEDSAAGIFTASYDADGNMVEEGLPNGLVAEQTYDEAGQLTALPMTRLAANGLTSTPNARSTVRSFGRRASRRGRSTATTKPVASSRPRTGTLRSAGNARRESMSSEPSKWKANPANSPAGAPTARR